MVTRPRRRRRGPRHRHRRRHVPGAEARERALARPIPGAPCAGKGGTLILGGGFGGAHVARLLGGATIVSPESSMLYTPLLPEVAAGAIEPRHVFVPLRMMCPRRRAAPRPRVGPGRGRSDRDRRDRHGVGRVVSYRRLVIALGSTARVLPIPGLAEHALTFKDLSDAIHLRNHVVRRLDLAESDPRQGGRHLTFVFVGAGYAGVEALRRDEAARPGRPPPLPGPPRRTAALGPRRRGPRDPGGGARRLARLHERASCERHGVEILTSSRRRLGRGRAVTLANGGRIDTETLVWTAGVVANPLVRAWGCRSTSAAGSSSTPRCGSRGARTSGRSGTAPPCPTPRRPTGSTRPRASTPCARPAPWPPRSAGETRPYATAASAKGPPSAVARASRGSSACTSAARLGALITRAYHIRAVPLRSRRLRILADGLLSTVFRRDIAELGQLRERHGSRRPSVRS